MTTETKLPEFEVNVEKLPRLVSSCGLGFIWTNHPEEFTYSSRKNKAKIFFNRKNLFVLGLESVDKSMIAIISSSTGFIPNGFYKLEHTDGSLKPYNYVFVWGKDDPFA